jgi:hypothetical protein
MALARTAAEVLKEHVVLEIEGIDRMYLNMYIPDLQRELGVVGFFRTNRGYPITSGALMSPMTQSFVKRIESFAEARDLPIVVFEKGQRKEDIARERRKDVGSREGIYLVGKAQEKARVWRTETRRNPQTGGRYPWIVWSTAMVNHYYFYGVDAGLRQWVLTFPFAWRAALAQDGALLGSLTRILEETVQGFYAQRARQEGHLGAKTGSVAVLQRA